MSTWEHAVVCIIEMLAEHKIDAEEAAARLWAVLDDADRMEAA